jgi:NADH-quinone oxidoreductase subunit L
LGPRLKAPLIVLALLSIFGGLLRVPWIRASGARPGPIPGEAALEILSAGVVLLGLALAYGIFVRMPEAWAPREPGRAGKRRLGSIRPGWGFDRLYDRLFVRPLLWLAKVNRDDVLDLPFLGLAQAGRDGYGALSRAQSGRLRRYAAVMAAGVIIVIALAVLL